MGGRLNFDGGTRPAFNLSTGLVGFYTHFKLTPYGYILHVFALGPFKCPELMKLGNYLKGIYWSAPSAPSPFLLLKSSKTDQWSSG